MEGNKHMQENVHRLSIRLSPEASEMMKQTMNADNCKSQNEFVENAVRFYAGYLASKNATEYLAPILSQVLNGTLTNFGANISRNLFRLAVEDAKTWILFSAVYGITPEDQEAVSRRALSEVKRLNGKLTYERCAEDPMDIPFDNIFVER